MNLFILANFENYDVTYGRQAGEQGERQEFYSLRMGLCRELKL